jgi:hypothetical protein
MHSCGLTTVPCAEWFPLHVRLCRSPYRYPQQPVPLQQYQKPCVNPSLNCTRKFPSRIVYYYSTSNSHIKLCTNSPGPLPRPPRAAARTPDQTVDQYSRLPVPCFQQFQPWAGIYSLQLGLGGLAAWGTADKSVVKTSFNTVKSFN